MAENADRPFDPDAAAQEFLKQGAGPPPADLVAGLDGNNGAAQPQEETPPESAEPQEPVEPPDDLTTEELRAMAARRGEAYERAKGGRDDAREQVQQLTEKVQELEQYQQDWSALTNIIAPHGRTPQEAVNNFVAQTQPQQPQPPQAGYDEYGQPPPQQVQPMPTLPSQQIWGPQQQAPAQETPAEMKQMLGQIASRLDAIEGQGTQTKFDQAIHRELQRRKVPVTTEMTDLVRNVMLGGNITSVGRAMEQIQKTFGGFPGGQAIADEANSLNPTQGATTTPPGTPTQPGPVMPRAGNREELQANEARVEDFVRRVLEQNDPSDLHDDLGGVRSG